MARFFHLLERRPIVSFVVLLVLLSGIIVLATKLRAPSTVSQDAEKQPRSVPIFIVDEDTPSLSLPAEVKKTGIISVIALTPGVVERILVTPGQKVSARQTLITLSNDNGAQAAALRAQIAQENLRLTEKNYSTNKKLAELTAEIADDDATTDAKEELARKNLSLAKRTLESDRTINHLSTQAAVAELKTLTPSSPVSGTLQHVAVQVGDYVVPGTIIATLTTAKTSAVLELELPQSIALLVNENGKHTLSNYDLTTGLIPRFFATQENASGLFVLEFLLPEVATEEFAHHSFVRLNIALNKTKGDGTLIPLDALFQAHGQNTVHIIDTENKVHSLEVAVEEVVGSYAIVHHLAPGTRIITDRLVVVGELVTSNR